MLIVGAGALGCPAAATLARAGVRLTILDFDRVARPNLPSQFLYGESDVGRPKAQAAADRLRTGGTSVEARVARFDSANADELVAAHDFVIDACDSPSTKLAINDAAVRAGRPFCYGGVSRTGGLVLSVEPKRSACLACVFAPTAHDATGERTDDEHAGEAAGRTVEAAEAGGCHETGVLAPVAAVLGTLQALEALGALGVAGSWHPGRLAIYELRGRRWRFAAMPRDPRCAACAGEPTQAHARRTESCRV